MHERRHDPRTSKPFSLSNFLSKRAAEEGWLLAVVGNADGLVMGCSRDRQDKQAARIAAHASAEMFAGSRRSRFFCDAPSSPDVHLAALRFEVGGRPAFLAVLATGAAAAGAERLVPSVARILGEPPARGLAA